MSKEIITRLDLIAQLARKRGKSDIKFRTFVKCHDLDGEKLDTIVGETTERVESQIDCTTCANCCKSMEVVVDDADIRRLAKALSLAPAELERRYVKTAEDRVKHFATRPCPFLEGNKCSVYEDRPRACRDFPYLHSSGFRQRMLMMIENTAVCPIVFNTYDRLKDELGYRDRR